MWPWWGPVDLVLEVCWFLPLFIFNDIGLWWGDIFSLSWLQCIRYTGGCFFCLLLWRVFRALSIISRLVEYLGQFLYRD